MAVLRIAALGIKTLLHSRPRFASASRWIGLAFDDGFGERGRRSSSAGACAIEPSMICTKLPMLGNVDIIDKVEAAAAYPEPAIGRRRFAGRQYDLPGRRTEDSAVLAGR
jgi:hypothetical protein